MTDEATKLASEGKIGMPEFANGVLADLNNPESIRCLEDPQLLLVTELFKLEKFQDSLQTITRHLKKHLILIIQAKTLYWNTHD